MKKLVSIPQESHKEVELNNKYISSGGLDCPFCHSPNINAYGSEFDADYMWRNVQCEDCNAEWREEYKLVAAFDFQMPE